MNKTIALIGNPNCGKTTLFNSLTGEYAKVGNWSGVTIESKIGTYKKDKNITIVDLPGTYSLSPNGKDEQEVLKFVKENKVDCIVNVIDGLNLVRNLYLTSLLSTLNIPTVLAINFSDRLEKNGISLKERVLEDFFDVPVVKISAIKKRGLSELINTASKNDKIPRSFASDSVSNRYTILEELVDRTLNNIPTLAEKFTIKADNFLTGKYTGIPFFVLIIFAVYFFSLSLGKFFSDKISVFFAVAEYNSSTYLLNHGASEWVVSLFSTAVLKGIGAVLSFLPQILLLFFVLSLLEQSGYMARVSFITDKIFNKVNLSGKSVIPLVLSCGCAVSGIMASRAVEGELQRKNTIFISPFMPCGAKCAVFGWFSYKFFQGNPLIATSLYFLGGVVALVCSKILFLIKGDEAREELFLLEMPLLTLPRVKDVFLVIIEKVKDFLIKSGTVIFSVSVLLWFLRSFGIKGYVGDNIEQSFLFYMGNGIKFIFAPLGFGNWRASVAVLCGVFAKEAVIEGFELTGGNAELVFSSLYSVYAFMAFILLSPPCIPALAVAKREIGDNKEFAFMVCFQMLTAYIVALIINIIGVIVLNRLILPLIIGIIVLISLFFIFKRNKGELA